ncbi:protein shortage in chiasmata 1 ortholog isoform X2 [Trichomycterus rosablanca]|uniref:protein shortage in chiasmata 1 ortholog isoform X2 n=1 Tax=Trichomycterus rosablanca TaxID=2290929 RepID=UPI002F35526F
MFSAVRYKAIDYIYEASAKHRLMMNLLMLPVPVQLDISTYPHSGKLQEEAYRTPWARGSLHSTCELELTGPLLDDLKADLHSAHYLERFEVCVNELGGDVVPSSNPESQRCVESQEALWLLERGGRTAEQNGWMEKFSMAETHSARFSYQDLYRAEEVIVNDNQLKSCLPLLLTLVKRLKTLPVSDPLDVGESGSLFSEQITFRRCAPYEVSSEEPTHLSVIEEFRKERLSDTESLMLPTVIEPDLMQRSDRITSMTEMQEALSVNPEPAEEEITVLEIATTFLDCSGVLNVPGCENFSGPDLSSVITNTPSSPVPFRSHVEFETDLPLSLPSQPVQPERSLPTTDRLSAEPLSPVAITRRLLSDREREGMERAVWMAEKHHPCVAGWLLAEPWISEPPVRRRSMPELLSILRAERASDDTQNTYPLTLVTTMPSDPAFTLTEALTVERRAALNTPEPTEVDTTEKYTRISSAQIDAWSVEPSVSEESMQSRAALSPLPSLVRQGKTVKFILLEDDSLKQSTPCRNSSKHGLGLSKSNPATGTQSAVRSSINTDHSKHLYGLYESMAKNLELLKSAAGNHFANESDRESVLNHLSEDTQYENPAKYNHSTGGAHSNGLISEKSVPNPATPSHSTDAQTTACTENFLNTPAPCTPHSTNSSHHKTKNTRLQNHSAKHTYRTNLSQNTAIKGDHGLPYASPGVISHSAQDTPSKEAFLNNAQPVSHPNTHSVPNSTKPARNKGFHMEDTCPVHQTSNNPSNVNRLLPENTKNTFSKQFSSNNPGNLYQINNPATPATHAQANLSNPKDTSHYNPAHTVQELDMTPTEPIPTDDAETGGTESVVGNSTDTREHMDPLSSFMMLRSFLKSTVEQKSEQTPHRTTVSVIEPTPKSKEKKTVDLGMTVPHSTSKVDKVAQTQASVPAQGKAVSKTIQVPATDTERAAYQELHVLAISTLGRVRESGSNALRITDFSSLTPEHTRFSLKQQEKLISSGHGRESVYNHVALLHILVAVKELLLRCDLSTATDYLAKVCSTSTMSSLWELLRKFQVLQYMSRRCPEPQARVQHLQQQISAWLQRNISNKVLVVTAQESVRTKLVTALSQIPGNSVTALLTEQGIKLESQQLANSRCAVVCVQQVQSGFPWCCFSAVFEFECLGQSAVRNICTENNISYTCFITAVPCTDSSMVFSSPLDRVPFLLFITEGLLKRSDLLQLLESTYNMTLLERSHPPSVRWLGSTELYDIIAVDENTAVLLQELGELGQERASERVVIRISALSLQFSRCWLLLHCTEQYRALVCGSVLTNLVLIYSALVLLGHKSGGLDVKVLLVCDVADIAQCVYQICLHTLLTADRDVCGWLDRDWFSVLPTQEEQLLLYFPCINCVVAQLMLSRAPSLQWLLEASHTRLEEMFPEITPSVSLQ